MKKKTKKGSGYFIDLDRRRRLLYTIDSFEIVIAKANLKQKDSLDFEAVEPFIMNMNLESSLSMFPMVVWAGLICEDPGLKIKDVERMIREKTRGNEMALGKMAEAITKARANYEGDLKFRREVFRKRGE